MTRKIIYEKYPNLEEYIKDYFGGLYVPPIKELLTKEGYAGLINLAIKCTEDTSPLIQGYHFDSGLAMRCFIRAIMYNIFECIISPIPFVKCAGIVDDHYNGNIPLAKFIEPPVLLIFYGKYERNHISNFQLANQISELRSLEDKQTFILSLQSEKEIKTRQEEYNRQNPQKQKPVQEFCVPLVKMDKVTIHDLKGITRQWEGESILQPKIYIFYESSPDIEMLTFEELPSKCISGIEDLID